MPALQFIHPSSSVAATAVAQVLILTQLAHRHIVRVFGVAEGQGCWYLVQVCVGRPAPSLSAGPARPGQPAGGADPAPPAGAEKNVPAVLVPLPLGRFEPWSMAVSSPNTSFNCPLLATAVASGPATTTPPICPLNGAAQSPPPLPLFPQPSLPSRTQELADNGNLLELITGVQDPASAAVAAAVAADAAATCGVPGARSSALVPLRPPYTPAVLARVAGELLEAVGRGRGGCAKTLGPRPGAAEGRGCVP